MLILLLGMLIFGGIHIIPSFPGVRTQLVNRLGESLYLILFAVMVLASFALIVTGKLQAATIVVWHPYSMGYILAPYLILLGFIVANAMVMPSNINRFTRHPMLWSVVLWSSGHLLANGDAASIILFGGFGMFALYKMWSLNNRGATKSVIVHSWKKDFIIVVVGALSWAIVVYLHSMLFGVPVIQYLPL